MQNKTGRLFLDHASTTWMDEEVRAEIDKVTRQIGGNPSSIHEEGRRARFLIEESRETVAGLLGLRPSEVVFTGSATESINSVLQGYYWLTTPLTTFYSTLAEHHATTETIEFLGDYGARFYWLPVDQWGTPDIDSVTGPALVSLMAVNNELGTILPSGFLQELKKKQVKIHIDGVQGLGKIDMTPYLSADFLSFSGHKIRGPRGVGLMIIRQGNELKPLLHGGSQERNRRSGTEATALIAGFTLALKKALKDQAPVSDQIRSVNHHLRSLLHDRLPSIRVNSPETGSPWILNLTLFLPDGRLADGEAVIMGLDSAGISVSNGSACSSGSFEPSHVLFAIGQSTEEARSGLRISFGHDQSLSDVQRFVEALYTVLSRQF